MAGLRTTLRRGFDRIERPLDRLFGPDWNPLANLGPLGWLLFWIVAASGIYLFICQFFLPLSLRAFRTSSEGPPREADPPG